MNPIESQLRERFQVFAGREGRVSFAPGRVNLIGEHTDYTAGFVLPASLAMRTWAAAAPRTDSRLRVYSEAHDEVAELPLDSTPSVARGEWSDYVIGVAWALQRTGRRLRGADLYITGDLPIGSGLSSSAALEVATAFALLDAAQLEMPSPFEIARACQVAENQYVGSRCGIMDQFIATHGRRGGAMLLDCGTFDWREVPLPASHRFIVADTTVKHALARGEYNIRRAECEEIVSLALHRLPHRVRLPDLTADEVEKMFDELQPTLASRLRHVITENRRVHETVAALETGDAVKVGTLLTASHASLRDDFEVSCRELDVMVDLALGMPGVRGARMIGGGFGGCTLTLVDAALAAETVTRLREEYADGMGLTPTVFECEFGDAAGVVP
jgi:galactokinase